MLSGRSATPITGDPDRRTATTVGVLFIIATVVYLVGGAIYAPALASSDYLEHAYPDRDTATLGVLIEFACVVSIPLIAVFLFPLLRRTSEALAVAYVGFRALEAMFLFGIEAKLLSLIDVSEDYLNASGADAARMAAAGDTIYSEIDAAFLIYVLLFGVGALFLYSLLYRSNLVPHFLSIWGFGAAVWMLAGMAGVMFDLFSGMSDSLVEALIVTPIAINEMVLAGWLIAKGFDRSAASAAPSSEVIRPSAPA